MFHADVTTNAPKDRTLFNYNIAKDGWPKLRDFLGLPITEESFPHENKNANTVHFAQVGSLYFGDTFDNMVTNVDTCYIFFQHLLDTAGEEYNKKVDAEIIAYMNQNGYDCKRIQ